MRRSVSIILRSAVGILFVYAGITKAIDPSEFTVAIEGYRLVPHWAAALVALYLPWLEIICGIALMSPWRGTRSSAACLVASMLLVFIIAIASAWGRGLDITCGCFGEAPHGQYGWLVIRDIMLLATLVAAAVADRRVGTTRT